MSHISFNSLLSKVPSSIEPFGYKSAQFSGIEQPDGQQMEQDFAQLAFMFVNDRAPALIKYIIGFEVVEREEDNSRAVGMFGCKVGKDYYYIPAFFLNNQIKGLDLIFDKRTNMFTPLHEDWVNSIINKETIELGESVNQKDLAGQFENPDFSFLTHPPMGPRDKLAEADEFWSLKEAWDKMRGQIQNQLDDDPEFQVAVAGFISSMQKKASPVERTGDNSPLKTWMSDFGGPKAVSAFLTTLTTNVKYANAALTFYPSVESLYVHEFKSLPTKTASVYLTSTPTDDMELEDKRRLVRDGFAIIDKRAEDTKSETYDISYTQRFSSPTEPGLYKVVNAHGAVDSCWVLNNVGENKTGYGNPEKCFVLYYPDSDTFTRADSRNVYARDNKAASIDRLYRKSRSLLDAAPGNSYLILNEKGDTLGVYTFGHVSKDGDESYITVSREYLPASGAPLFKMSYYINKIVPVDRVGDVRMTSDGNAIVPSNWKVVQVARWKEDTYMPRDRVPRRSAPELGTPTDVDLALFKNAFHRFTVASDDGREYYFRVDDDFATPAMGYKQAYASLVGKYGLDVNDAGEMLKEASTEYKSRRLVKFAQQGVGVSMPVPSDPEAMGIDPYTGMPVYDMTSVQQSSGTLTGLPPMPDGNVPGINIGGEAQVDTEAQDLAMQAAELGQKTVFDHSTIGGLANLYDTSAVIDSYIPEMLQTLDRLGRILFLYYWKNEDFAERYGSQDIADMEDLIRSVFKSFGTLVLRLRQKTIEVDDARNLEIG